MRYAFQIWLLKRGMKKMNKSDDCIGCKHLVKGSKCYCDKGMFNKYPYEVIRNCRYKEKLSGDNK
jgi:hypothetical protein